MYTSVSRPKVYWWKCSKEKRFRVRERSTGVHERFPFLHQCCTKASARGSILGGLFHSWIIMRQQKCSCDKFLQLAHPSLLLFCQFPVAVLANQPSYWLHDSGESRETFGKVSDHALHTAHCFYLSGFSLPRSSRPISVTRRSQHGLRNLLLTISPSSSFSLVCSAICTRRGGHSTGFVQSSG